MDCCSQLMDNLPRAEMRFFPAVTLGVLFSLLILLYLFSKKRKLSYFEAIKTIGYEWFVALPQPDHPDFTECKNKDCAKCKRSEEVKMTLLNKWQSYPMNTSPKIKRIAQAVESLQSPSGKSKSKQKPTILSVALQPNAWWTDLDVFHQERQLLKINYNIIKEEFEHCFKPFELGNTDGWKLNDIPSGHWCIFPIIDQGLLNEANAKRCPNTTALLGSLPSVMKNCVFGNACFSLIYPDSEIEPHHGPSNIRLRCHFGIKIPQDCFLEVNGTQCRWQVGESLIFDDSFEHYAYYGSKKTYANPRVILLVDLWHPQLTTDEKQALEHILPPLA